MSGTLDPTSLQMFDVSSVVTPAAATNVQAVEVYKSNLTMNGASPGAAGGIVGSVFSSFQHQLRLRADPAGGTGHFTSVFGFYSPPITTVDAGLDRQTTTRAAAGRAAQEEAGTILNLTGLDIRDFKARGTTNYSLRSFGPGVHMRHSGGVGLGSQATPETILHLRGNASFHGSVTLDQESSDPTPPSPSGAGPPVCKGRQARRAVERRGARRSITTIPLATPGAVPCVHARSPPTRSRLEQDRARSGTAPRHRGAGERSRSS